jgi:hypothetical protein
MISVDFTNSSAQQMFNMEKLAENMLIELYHKYIKTHKYYEPVRDFVFVFIILIFIIISLIFNRKKMNQTLRR